VSGNQQPIIIKRIKKAAHAHHGGAWKVAYADFVTAMMAFFLLLWLLNVTTDIERKGIADYFAPASVSKSESGAGGAFGGQTITSPGAQISDSAPPGASKAIPEPDESEEGRKDDPGAGQPEGADKQSREDVQSGFGKDVPEAIARLKIENVPEGKPEDEAKKTEEEKRKAEEERKRKEEEAFKKAEAALRDAIRNSPEMAELEKSLLIDSTPEGLRIQIVDRDGYSLFAAGSPRLADKSRRLVTLVGMVIARLPNRITVTGHTDSKPYRGIGRSSNWELSAARAFSSADVLIGSGLSENRLQAIIGKADKEPLVKEDPEDQQNRRISIVLLRKAFGFVQADGTPVSGTPGNETLPDGTPVINHPDTSKPAASGSAPADAAVPPAGKAP
jgi:chemotaxis protein MotB